MIRTLVVDDEPALLEISKIFLERSGEITVDTANSAYAALNSMGTVSYDVIVSDYEMPGMDGILLLKKIREGGGKTPFILFTRERPGRDRDRGAQLRGDILSPERVPIQRPSMRNSSRKYGLQTGSTAQNSWQRSPTIRWKAFSVFYRIPLSPSIRRETLSYGTGPQKR